MIDILNKLSIVIAPIFYKLLFLSITGAIIGVIILFIRKIFDKKIPPVWKYVMWIVVALALIVPLRFNSNISLTQNISKIENVSFREKYDSVKYEEFIYSQSPNIDVEKSEQLQNEKSSLFYKSLVFDITIPLLWFFGMIFSLIFLIVHKLYLSYKIKINTIKTNDFDNILNVCKSKLNIDSNIETVYQYYINSPALFGLFKPKILLPKYVNTMSKESLYYIILHELAHYKRKDMLVNYILLAIQIFHWFNPIVWFLFKEIREDMEVLNDSYVIGVIGKEESKGYSKSLVEVLGLSHNVSLMPKLMCMTDGKKNVERRISMIKLGESFKKHKLLIAVFCIVLITIIGGLFLTKKNESKDSTEILFDNRTDSISNKKQIENIVSHLRYPKNIEYKNVNKIISDDSIGLTINLAVNTDDYAGNINQFELEKIAFTVFSLVGDVGEINFSVNDGLSTYPFSFYRNQVDSILSYDCFARSETLSGFKGVLEDIESLKDIDVSEETEKNPYSINTNEENGDMQITILNTKDFDFLGKKNEGFAYYENVKKKLHLEVTTDIGQPKATKEYPGAGVKFDYDNVTKTLENLEFTKGDNNVILKVSEEELTDFAESMLNLLNVQDVTFLRNFINIDVENVVSFEHTKIQYGPSQVESVTMFTGEDAKNMAKQLSEMIVINDKDTENYTAVGGYVTRYTIGFNDNRKPLVIYYANTYSLDSMNNTPLCYIDRDYYRDIIPLPDIVDISFPKNSETIIYDIVNGKRVERTKIKQE